MRILWHSNAPWAPTGYGNQTEVFAERIHAMPERDMVISAFYGLEGSMTNWKGIPVFPRWNHPYGNDAIEPHFSANHCELLVTLMDVWVLDPAVMSRLPWLAWAPVDHDPIPPAVAAMLKHARWPVAYSRFGYDQMIAAGLPARYVPHGIDTETFKPVDRVEARADVGQWMQRNGESVLNEDTFLVAVVAANKGIPSRKALPELLEAWEKFSSQHRNVHLYLHTERYGTQGMNLDEVIQGMGIDASTVTFAPQYAYQFGQIGQEFLNKVYNAADVLLNPAYGEGFGLPSVEAQAAGCPVILGDNSAQRELLFSGWSVKGTRYWGQQSWQQRPNVEAIANALCEAKEAQNDDELRKQARAGALPYDADVVTETYWKPLLDEIADGLEATRKVVVSLAEKRAARRERKQAARRATEDVVQEAEAG